MADNYKQNMMSQYLRFNNPELLFLHHLTDFLRNFRAKHPYISAVLSVALVGTGIALLFPAAKAVILGAVGFGAGGVIAGPSFLLKASSLNVN